MKDYYSPFESNHFYHIYNHADGSENIFKDPKNYNFFLERWDDYLTDFVDVWAYCLMPNHFHFLVKIRPHDRLARFLKLDKFDTEIISNQFRSLFISYAKSFNKVYDRHGSLFQKPFKHVLIDSRNYLLTLIHYIHHNPIHHGFIEDFTDWTNTVQNVFKSWKYHSFFDYKAHFFPIGGLIPRPLDHWRGKDSSQSAKGKFTPARSSMQRGSVKDH